MSNEIVNPRKAKWYAIIADWKSSGLSRAAYCNSRQLNTSSFYRWCKYFDNEPSPNQSSVFAKIKIKDAPEQSIDHCMSDRQIKSLAIFVQLPNDLQVNFSLPNDGRSLSSLMKQLREV